MKKLLTLWRTEVLGYPLHQKNRWKKAHSCKALFHRLTLRHCNYAQSNQSRRQELPLCTALLKGQLTGLEPRKQKQLWRS